MDAILRLMMLLSLIAVACQQTVGKQIAASDDDAIRASVANHVRVLKVDGDFAVARTETQVVAFIRNRDEQWMVGGEFSLPLDWESESERGFSTYFDEAQLRSAFGKYLKWHAAPMTEVPVSSTSTVATRHFDYQLVRVALDDEDICYDDNWTKLKARCVGADGRYAFFFVTNLGQLVGDDECAAITRDVRFVVFRADDGKNWLVHDDVSLADYYRRR